MPQGTCADIFSVLVMLSIVGHVFNNYEQLEAEGRSQ